MLIFISLLGLGSNQFCLLNSFNLSFFSGFVVDRVNKNVQDG